MLFLSPLLAAYLVHVAQTYFGPDSVLLANFSIPLFLCAAMLRPAIFFLREGGTPVEGEEVRRLRYQLGAVLDRVEQLEAATAGAPAHAALPNAAATADLRGIAEEIEARARKQHAAAAAAERQNRRIAELECSLLALQAARAPSSLCGLVADAAAYATRLLLLPLTLAASLFDRSRSRNKKK